MLKYLKKIMAVFLNVKRKMTEGRMIMNAKRQIISLVLVVVFCFGLLPTVALAEEGTESSSRKIMLNTSGIEGPTENEGSYGSYSGQYYEPNSYIYFGLYDSDNPIKWRVLDEKKANNGADGIFLLFVIGKCARYNGIWVKQHISG